MLLNVYFLLYAFLDGLHILCETSFNGPFVIIYLSKHHRHHIDITFLISATTYEHSEKEIRESIYEHVHSNKRIIPTADDTNLKIIVAKCKCWVALHF
jgi:hypothetical protein